VTYLETLDRMSQTTYAQNDYSACIRLCQRILDSDACREDAHCRLMRCYSRLGQTYLAVRQFHLCAETLKAELEVDPEPGTVQLYEHIRNRERI
jgi:DNA-binding SARP family transcriptional activator